MNRRPLPRSLLGVLVVAIGVAALLDQLGLLDVSLGDLVSTWWPLAIIAVGVAALVTVPRAWVGPAVILTVGVLLQLGRLGMLDVSLWGLLWPLAIILVGISLLTRLGSPGTDDAIVNSVVLWWGSERRSTSQAFRGGSLSAIMGGIELDLRQAAVVERAEIAVFALWGGVEITVPPTWRVTVSGLPLLGAWENTTTPPADPHAPELVVHVTAIMGGVEITSPSLLSTD
ncbi:cell wall-active antibiotics response protein [Cellulomonas sp. NS3]|uniref:cell wall-active antibiotics response protein n=1 Tax=Cellulomonas sp. NS3 TaxID=2973977 RepID=UPI0021619E02|nr:cell wall-active antibiotics response protein [Cellulomonas sp. NS3]